MNSAFPLPPIQSQLLRWSSEMSFWIADVIDICRSTLGPDGKLDDRTKLVLWQLAASCHSTSESALLLVGNVRLWDADVLARSVVEGTLKFVFLTIGNKTDRAQKIKEFDDDFAAFGQLKKHQRIEEFLSVVGNPDADEWRPFRELLLKPEILAELKRKYPKKFRQQIEQKWSFSEISASLKKSKIQGVELFGHLLFNYGMSSHVAHQDTDGIGMVWDRNNRDTRRREAVELAHGARLVSDISVMAWLRAYALFELTGLDKTPLKALNEKLKTLHKETAQAAKSFHEVEYGNESKPETNAPSQK